MTKYAFFEGKIVPIEEAKVSVMTHALHYGTACFGGIRAYWNDEAEQLYVFRLTDHIERFLSSTKLLLMNLPYSPEHLRGVVLELLRCEGFKFNSYVRPLAYKADLKIGVLLHGMTDEVTIFATPFGRYVANEEGASVRVSSWRRIDDNAIPARGKIAGAYVNSGFVKSEALMDGYDEAIVLDQHGHVSEGSAENIFMVRNGQLSRRRYRPTSWKASPAARSWSWPQPSWASKHWSERSTAPSCTSVKSCSFAAPASRWQPSRRSIIGPWAPAAWARSPRLSATSTSTSCAARCRSIITGTRRCIRASGGWSDER